MLSLSTAPHSRFIVIVYAKDIDEGPSMPCSPAIKLLLCLNVQYNCLSFFWLAHLVWLEFNA